MSAIRDRIATLADNFTAGIAADRICDQFIVIDREELPKVTPHHEEDVVECNNATYYIGGDSPVQLFRQVALNSLAISEYAQDAAYLAICKRRDELAAEFTAVSSYGGQLPYTQKLIDRIIELEQAQS